MEIKKTIKANIIYYYIAGAAYLLLIIAATNIFPLDATGYTTLNFYILLPVISVILGFVAGGARSYAKWGFPVYIALLAFCLTVLLFNYENWFLILISFTSSLTGVIIRHLINVRRRTGK